MDHPNCRRQATRGVSWGAAAVSVPPLRVVDLKRLMRRHDGRVNACIIGCGAAGSVLAKELAEGGMTVVVLEAGGWIDAREDMVNDELSMLAGSTGTTCGSRTAPIRSRRAG